MGPVEVLSDEKDAHWEVVFMTLDLGRENEARDVWGNLGTQLEQLTSSRGFCDHPSPPLSSLPFS